MKKIIIIIATILIVCGLGILTFIYFDSKNILIPATPEILTYTEVELGKKTYINSLKEISIGDSKDKFIVTEDVRWEVPEVEGEATVSFSMIVPYKFIIDDIEYEGKYTLSSSNDEGSKDDNPKYDLVISDLTTRGEIQIKITEK